MTVTGAADPMTGTPIAEEPSVSEEKSALAYNPTNQQYLVVWRAWSGQFDVYGRLLDSTGSPLDDLIPIATTGNEEDHPAVAYGAGTYLVVWADGTQVLGQQILASGELTGTAITISDGSLNSQPSIDYNPVSGEFLVAWVNSDYGNQIRLQRVGADGQLVGDQIAITGSFNDLAPASIHDAAGDYLVVFMYDEYPDQFAIWGQRLDGDGTLVNDAFPIYSAPSNSTIPAIAYNPQNDEYLVTWRESTEETYQTALVQRLDADGSLIGSATDLAAQTGEYQTLDMAYRPDSNDYLIVWPDDRAGNWDVYGQVVNADGSLQNSTPFAIVEGPDDQLDATVDSQVSGTLLVVAYSDNRHGDPNVYAQLYPPDSSAWTPETVIHYDYDPLERLISADYSGAHTYAFAYDYDSVGNRTVQTRTITNTQVTNFTYDAANRLSNGGGVNYTWDNNGNLINDGSVLYRYDQANRLISTTLSGVTSLYNYNGDGVRLRQVVAGTPTTYTQDSVAPLPVVLQSKTGATTSNYLYSIGTRPIGQYTSAWEYLLPDALGSVRQIADASGNVTLAESYEPYGSVLTSTGTASSIFAYAGEQIDTYIKLVFLRSRYYSPDIARFLSKDVWQGDYTRPQSLNAWGYTEGNPINRIDPAGQWWCRPSPHTPSCEKWIETALNNLAYGKTQSHEFWRVFLNRENIFGYGIYFDANGINQTEPPWSVMHLNSDFLNDTIPSKGFDYHVSLFVHEGIHLLQSPLGAASIQHEVEAYVWQWFIMQELNVPDDPFFNKLYVAGWDVARGQVSDSYEKLCKARKILTEDPYVAPAHNMYKDMPVIWPWNARRCECYQP